MGGNFSTKVVERLPDAAEGVMGSLQTLFRAALKDPRNQRFVLLSDLDIPLYPAAAVYHELMQDTLSRWVRGWGCLVLGFCRVWLWFLGEIYGGEVYCG